MGLTLALVPALSKTAISFSYTETGTWTEAGRSAQVRPYGHESHCGAGAVDGHHPLLIDCTSAIVPAEDI